MANKKDIVKAVAEANEWTQKEAAEKVEAVVSTIKATIATGETVQLTGFGKFEVRESAERKGRNPQTNQPMTIPATKRVKFKVGKNLASDVANS